MEVPHPWMLLQTLRYPFGVVTRRRYVTKIRIANTDTTAKASIAGFIRVARNNNTAEQSTTRRIMAGRSATTIVNAYIATAARITIA